MTRPSPADPLPLSPGLRRVLVVQTDHHLGNAVLSFPVVAALGRHFSAGIDLLVDARYAEVAEGLPGVARVLEMPAQRDGFGNKQKGVAATAVLLARLVGRRYEAVIDLAGVVRSGPITRIAGWRARDRVGFLQARRAGAYTRTIDAPDVARTGAHFFDRYARVLACVGRADDAPWPPPVRLCASEDARAAVASKLGAAFPDGDGPLVVLHPAAGIAWRCWPAERFAAVAAGLITHRNARVLIVGTAGDAERAAEIRSVAGEGGADRGRAGHGGRAAFASWPLPELLALFEEADLLVSNESGPTHLAAAVGTPTVTVFGPTSEVRWRPLPVEPERLRVLRGAPCDPGCHGRTCVAGLTCLTSLPADRVLAEAEALLDAGRT